MEKSLMLSIHPFYCEKIAFGEKDVEIRKNKPNLEPPFKCYIYCTKPKGKVIGEFICDRIEYLDIDSVGIGFWQNDKFIYFKDIGWNPCLTREKFINYSNGKRLYGWHISNLKVYDKPKPLSDFYIYKYLETNTLPCETAYCEYDYFDYSENCKACRLDFDGANCPKIKMNRPPQSWCYVVKC